MTMIPLVMADEAGRAQIANLSLLRIVVFGAIASAAAGASLFGRKHQRG